MITRSSEREKMEFNIYQILIVIMFLLAASDLIVGVANDAVNFTNSAVGSNVSSRKFILIVASIGILIGATTSTGMMEVARKGIFRPELYSLENLLYIFLAVMITDILLLDVFNTFGLPTSTTVSLVFELFGAGLMIAFLTKPEGVDAFSYINSQSAIKIISGIFLSIIVAFICGIVFQSFSRILFTFNLKTSMKYFGSFFAALSTSIVSFFIVISALKDSSLLAEQWMKYLNENLAVIFLIGTFVLWIVFQILVLFGFNIFKFIILFGTFALAMAFAGNDLVNFVGVPIAGYNTIQLINQSNDPSALGVGLAGQVHIPGIFLIVSGFIMIATLIFSKKAHTVTKTEISLASERQEHDLFSSNLVGRRIVGLFLEFWTLLKNMVPQFLTDFLKKRYKRNNKEKGNFPTEAFDHLRASVNITTASLIIMTGTLYKLPLSTTFVTFMVAMGSSLADRAWTRQSSVSRVSGVLTVIGGWFLTAAITSVMSGIIVTTFHFLGFYVLILLIPFVLFLLYSFSMIHRRREKLANEVDEKIELLHSNPQESIQSMLSTMSETLLQAGKILERILKAQISGKKKEMKGSKKDLEKFSMQYSLYMSRIAELDDRMLTKSALLSAFNLENSLHNFRRIINNIITIRESVETNLDNYFTALNDEEAADLQDLRKSIKNLFESLYQLSLKDKIKKTSIKDFQKNLSSLKYTIHKNQMKRVKKGKSHINNLVPYLMIVEEMMDLNKNLIDLYEDMEKLLSMKISKN
jgi:phosphate/sulfate permease